MGMELEGMEWRTFGPSGGKPISGSKTLDVYEA